MENSFALRSFFFLIHPSKDMKKKVQVVLLEGL